MLEEEVARQQRGRVPRACVWFTHYHYRDPMRWPASPTASFPRPMRGAWVCAPL